MVCHCGLVTGKNEPVPLKSIEVEVKVNDHVATVSSTLQYENKEEQPLEAIFVFPLPAEAAVCHFSAKIGETEVVAHVKEKKQAREEYDDALSSGQQAFLLEESEQSSDVFQLNVGSLPPGESASIRLEYVTELAVQADDGLRICLPAVLNPRYEPQGVNSGGGGSAQVTSVPASAVPYNLSVKAHVSSPRPISKVESNCPLDPLNYLNPEQTQATISLAAGHKFDRDVELLVYYKDAHQPTPVVESGQASAKPGSLMGDTVVMLSLYPEFPTSVMSSMTSSGEFIFLVDRSGSMSCPMHRGEGAQERIGSARDTLLLLLKSLPMGCYFNIFGFGSNYESFFPKSVEYSQQTMDDALNKVQTMGADMGGTEILEPLKHIYSQSCIPNQPRQLFLFTDGEVGNTKQVLDLVKKNAKSHRCFSFGIGEGASSALISGVAKEGGGHSQFITGTDRMQPKVMQSLRFALQPAVVDIAVDWKVPKGVSVTPLSQPISVLFQGQRSLIYAQLTGESSKQTEGSVTVKYSLAKQPVKNQLCFSLKPAEDTGLTVHRLGARTLIRSLEVEERGGGSEKKATELKDRVVNLSVQSGVSSVFTAFIAVHKGSGEAVKGPMLRRNVPTPRIGGGGGGGGSMRMGRSLYHAAPMAKMRLCAAPMIMCHSAFPGGRTGTENQLGTCKRSLSRDLCEPSSVYCDAGTHSIKHGFEMADNFEMAENTITVPELTRDPLFQLISLQKASGSWVLETALVLVLGKTLEEVDKTKPEQVDQEVWATVLALIWLHGFKIKDQDEWQLLAIKAVAWIQAQNVPFVPECVAAGNALLGCKVQKETLGL